MPGVARVQAAQLSPEICIVVVEKDNFPTRGEGKPTLWSVRKAAVLSHGKASEEDTTGV
jgi:hypothetical protein